MKGYLSLASLLCLSATAWGAEPPGYKVVLTWTAPAASADPVVGYDIYRAGPPAGWYTKLNATPVTATTWTDDSVQFSTGYTYYVVSVDLKGRQSAPCRAWSIMIPSKLSYTLRKWRRPNHPEFWLLLVMSLAMAALIAIGVYIAWMGSGQAAATRAAKRSERVA